MDYTIEKSDISNLPDIAKLNQEIFSGMYENEPYNLKDFQNKLQDKKPLILVAKHNDTLIGFSISFPRNDSFYIWILGVLDWYRNHGIASKFLYENKEFAKDNGFTTMIIKTYNVSPEMLRLLIKHGYYIVDVEKSDTFPKYNSIHLQLDI